MRKTEKDWGVIISHTLNRGLGFRSKTETDKFALAPEIRSLTIQSEIFVYPKVLSTQILLVLPMQDQLNKSGELR